jgi:Ca2+-binding RTX toxin-like protein
VSPVDLFFLKRARRVHHAKPKRRRKASSRHRSFVFEPLEPRLLLSADISPAPLEVDMATAGSALTVSLDLTQTLQVTDSATGAPVSQRALSETSKVAIRGSDTDDALTIDVSVFETLPIEFFSGLGSDSLHGPNANALLHITGRGLGVVGNVTFEDVENLFGGAGQDEFVFSGEGSVDGLISGGENTDMVRGPDSDNVWTLTEAAGGTLNGQTFSGVENLSGGSGEDLFIVETGGGTTGTLDGGEGSDTLVGPDAPNAWTITGANAGELNGQSFGDIENLTGGADADTFTFLLGGSLSGVLSGGLGFDTLVGADTSNVWTVTGLDAGTLNGQSFQEIENLLGGAEQDLFVFAGGRISGTIDGGGGFNVFDYSADAAGVEVNLATGTATGTGGVGNVGKIIGGSGDDTLIGPDDPATWNVTGPNAGQVVNVEFTGIENLIGGSSTDTFVLMEGWWLSGLLDGGLGFDLVIGADAANTWAILGPDEGALNGVAFVRVEDLLGGAAEDLFAFALTGYVTGAVAGGLGRDLIRGADRKNTWRLRGVGTGTLNDQAFSGMEVLEGGSDEDGFLFDDGADFGGTVEGGDGANTLDYSAFTSSVTVDLAARTGTGIGGFSSIDEVKGGQGTDTLKGPAEDSTWTVTSANAGSVGGVGFSGFEDLQGSADNEDTFIIADGGSVSGLLQGGDGGFDTIVIADGDYSVKVYTVTGPDSGSISLDGTLIEYAGFEPLVDQDPDANEIEFNLTNNVDLAVLSITGATELTLDSTDDGFEDHSFDFTGVATITINLLNGDDELTLQSIGTYAGTLVINAGSGDDTITLQSITASASYDIDGGSTGETSGDTIIVTADQNMTLSNTQLVVGAETISISDIEIANLTGGAGANIFTVSDWTGTGTLAGEGGSDTYKFDDDWGDVTVVEAAGGGTDTLDFGPFSDVAAPRSSITIAPQLGGGVVIEGDSNNDGIDDSSMTLSSTSADNFESLINANINLTGLAGLVGDELVGGLESMVTFMRNLAAVGEFATALPLLGGSAEVTVGKALDLAEALDELRVQVSEFFAATPTVTTDALIAELDSLFGGAGRPPLSHLGAAILSPGAVTDADVNPGDTFNFSVTLNSGTPVAINATGADTVADLVVALNTALGAEVATSGQIVAAERNGRIAFQVVGTEINTFSVLAAVGAARTKLGFSNTAVSLSQVQDILRNLGDLNVMIVSGVTLATSFDNGDPQLRFDVNYRGDRSSEFFFNLGPEAQGLGFAFDLDAKLTALTQLVFDFQLGLELAPTDATFFLDVDELRAGVETTLAADAVTNAGLNIGFLDVTANGTLSLTAGVAATLGDTLEISAAQLVASLSGGGGLLSGGSLALTGADGTGSPNFDLGLTISVEAGLSSLGGFTATGSLTASGDPFNGPSITLSTDTDFDANFPSFNNLNSAGVISLLGQISGWLDGLREGDLIKSIDIPFVEGALDRILDLAEVLSDALLYDEGPDDVKDGANKLVTDLNLAIADAGLDGVIRAQGDGSSIDLIAIDPTITEFSIAAGPGNMGGFAQLGFAADTSDPGVPTISGGTAPVNGIIVNKAVIRFTIERGSETTTTDVTLEAEATTANTGVGDDVAKLIDENNGPLFATAQELAARLVRIITLGTVNYDPLTSVLTYEVSFTDVPLFSVELPTDFEIDLSPIGNIQSDTRLVIDASGGIAFTLGFDLSDTPSGSTAALADDTTLASLDVDIKDEEAATADTAPRTIVGQLSGDANFSISYNPTVAVTVPRLSGRPGTDINVTQFLDDQSETAIAVNPVDPDNIIIGVNDFSAPDDDHLWFTSDAGVTWHRRLIPVPAVAPGDSAGDPSVVFSRDGSRLVYAHMILKTNGNSAIASAVSFDGGDTWDQADARVIGSLALDEDGDGFNDDNDKPYLAVGPDVDDPTQDRFIVTWNRSNVIYASTSLDGLTWTAPVVVGGLTGGSSTAQPTGTSIDAIPSFGPNGEIYVVWEEYGTSGVSHLMFDVSLDGGATWGGGEDETVLFATAEFDLTPEDDPDEIQTLNAFAALLTGNPQLVVTVAGYTDTVGLPADNQMLSQNRADEVAGYLIGQGIDASRITILAFGETHLAVPTVGDEPLNRRVELTLDQVIYTGNLSTLRDPFNSGLGYDGTDETNGSAAGDMLGEYEIPAQPTRGIWMSPSIDVDRSGGAHEGRIYVAFTDQGDLEGDPDSAFPADATEHGDTDIFVLASDDGGVTWAALGAPPVRVNDDATNNSQFFGWLDVDQSTGNVAISWYDARNDDGVDPLVDSDVTPNTDVQYFAAMSFDFGATWSANLQVSDGTSNVATTSGDDYGDYTALAFVNNTIHMAWADNSDSTGDNPDPAGPLNSLDTYYDRIRLTNETMGDLLDDINAAIAERPLLAGKFEAQAEGNVVKIVATDPSIEEFVVTTTTSDVAFRELGIQQSAEAEEDEAGNLVVEAAKNAPTLVGQLTADASFSIALAGGPTFTVTVAAAATTSPFAPNRNILDLVNDVQNAIDAADGSMTRLIQVSSAGGRLLFTRAGTPVLGTSDNFTITPGTNAGELGITSTLTSDEADLLITVDVGGTPITHRVSLDGATDIGDVFDRIETQTTLDVDVFRTLDDPETPVNEANTGLTLKDLTDAGAASGVFKVVAANGSLAGIQLGIIGMDGTPADDENEPDKTIVGAKIAGATLLDRLFITAPDLSNVINASIGIQAGLIVEDIAVVSQDGTNTVITSSSFEFTQAHADDTLQLVIRGVAGFNAGTYQINSVNVGLNQATITKVGVAGVAGVAGRTGGVGILKTGVQASANFGFVGIELTGDAALGAELSLGFNTGADEFDDSRLTLHELIDALDDPLSLLAPPDIQPLSEETNFGELDLSVDLTLGSSDFSALDLLGTTPSISIEVVTLGDPFLGTRFEQANYTQVNATQFTVDGDFTTKLPTGVTLRFDDGSDTNDVAVTSASFASGETTVDVDPEDPSFDLPTSLTGFDVTLLPKVNITTSDLDDLLNFENIGFDDILAALRALATFLSSFEAFSFLDQPLPLINQSVNDLLSFAADFTSSVDEAENNEAGTLQVLETKINESIGIGDDELLELFEALQTAPGDSVLGYTSAPNDVLDLSLVDGTILKFDLALGKAFNGGLDVSIPGIDFGSALAALGLGDILDLSGSAGLFAEGAVMLRLQVGIDLTNPTQFYLFEDTGLEASLEVGGEDVAFRVGVGPFALSIASTETTTAEVSIETTATVGFDPATVFDASGKIALGSALGNLDASLSGSASGVLPVFFPNDSTQLGEVRIGESVAAGFGQLENIGSLFIQTEESPNPAPTTDDFVIDVHDVVGGISGFNFDNFSLFDNIFLAIDGIDLALEFIENVIGGQIGGLTLPLIGDDLAKGAQFIADFREDFIGPLRAGVEAAQDAAQDFADPDKNIISELIFDLLGPDGINLLKPLDGSFEPLDDDSPADFIGLDTNLDDFLFDPDTTLTLSQVFIEWDLKLGSVLADASADIGFDLGIPGLGLETEGDITLQVEWELDLGFGLSGSDGFYLKVDDPHELLFDIQVGLPASIIGTLAFLELRAEDKMINVDGQDRTTELGATFMVDIFEKDALGNPLGGADGARLGFTEFGSIGIQAGVAAEAAATLGLELGLSPDLFVQIFGAGATDVIAGFPKVTSDFVFLWELGTRGSGATLDERADNSTFQMFDATFGNAIQEGLKLVAFQDVSLDLGTFLSDVIGPIVQEVSKYTEPIQPLIDFITSPIPIIGDLGLDITWLDLAGALAGDSFDVGLIQSIAEIITLINNIAGLSSAGEVLFPIGDFVIFDSANSNPVFQPNLFSGATRQARQAMFSGLNAAQDLDNVFGPGGIEGALAAFAEGNPGGAGTANTLKDVVSGTSAGGFDFPFLKHPEQIFGLLMGQPADLVTYDLAPLKFQFEFSQFFSIFGPLGVSIGLLVNFTADTAFGYDTLGIQQFVESGFRNPGLLFNGFFISDSPQLNDVDDPELTFLAELQAAAELNLGIARAGVAAALGFEIEFDLFDPNDDMKIRFTELIGNIVNQLRAPSDAEKLLAPLAIFDVSGEIFARLFAFLKIDFGFFTFKKNFPIFGPVTLLSFEVDFFRPPILASEQSNGDLIVHTGEFADQRLLGNATDIAEHLIIQSAGTSGDFVNVRIEAGNGALGDDSEVFQDYRVRRGAHIIIDGGEGNDIFDLTGFTEDGVLFEIDLGVGNDRVLWGDNPATGPIEGPHSLAGGVSGRFSTIIAGSGDDFIQGSGGSDLIFGNAGNDTIQAGGGADLVFGDEGEIGEGSVRGLVRPSDGRDIIDGGEGEDILIGGGGRDDLQGGTGSGTDLLLGGGGVVFFTSATAFPIFDNFDVTGSVDDPENLVLDPTAGDTVTGGDGADILFGTAGPDTITGGGGDDIIFGLGGFDTIDAGSGDDIVFGDDGEITDDGPVPFADGEADNIQGGTGDDKIFGGGGGDVIQGGGDDDRIFGGSGPDVIFGDNGSLVAGVPTPVEAVGDGADTIFGEGEPDRIYGGGGIDQIDGGAGADVVKGGSGDDLIVTNKSSDFLDGGDGGDSYLLFFQGGQAVSLMTVLDTGGPADVDIFVTTGTIHDDQFLLRANNDGSLAFVALINDEDHVERINYSFIERVVVNGSFGDDHFASDDTAAEVTLNGEMGDDTFQIGQMFRSERTTVAANVSVDDEFATIETTRGFLSNGISAPMTINGGIGNDLFVVFHNKAVLQLNGEEGDDVFEVRAFALTGSQEPQRERTDISGGAGADLVQYAVNAPVNIDGGDGFDTVIVIGTEFGDDLVITEDGVFGAGLNVNFVRIESLRVDGAEGNDRFFVKSTSEKFMTEIFGGLGEDTFNMSGDTPPIVSNDLRGHSGLIVHDVESTDPRFDDQALFGVSANVADNDEPFAVIRTSDGSTIVTEGGTLIDSYQIVLTRQPTKDVLIKALAPIPTPGDRERRSLAFRLDSPTAEVLTADGTGLTLRFTAANWWVPQTVQVFADDEPLTDIAGLFTRPEITGEDPDLDEPGIPFDMNDDAFEGVRFGVINHLVQAASATLSGTLSAIDNATPRVTITDPGTVAAGELVGRKLFITEGSGAGQLRFILDATDAGTTFVLTLDRPFVVTAMPTTTSKYFVAIDDAIVGTMSDFDETPAGIPPIADPEDHRSTFTDSAVTFPTAGEGLRGAILEIIGGPGAGQQRLILGNDPSDLTHTLVLNGPWSLDPVAGESIYRIERYDGLSIPSVQVQINDNDRAGLIVDETHGFKDDGDGVVEAADIVADIDTVTAVIEGGDGDQRGEQEIVQIRLSRDPLAEDVHVGLIYDSSQLLVTDLSGTTIDASNPLVFNSGNWDDFQAVLVTAVTDGLREGFHSNLIEFQISMGSDDETLSQTDTFNEIDEEDAVFFVGLSQDPEPGTVEINLNGETLTEADAAGLNGNFRVFSNKVVFVDSTGEVLAVSGDISVTYDFTDRGFLSTFTTPVLVRISDAEAPTVLVRETGGSTDVIELKRGGTAPESIEAFIYDLIQAFNASPWNDSYELVLTGQPTGDVTVTVTPEMTKTTRTGGIRHDAIQVEISSDDPRVAEELDGLVPTGNLLITFDATNWDDPVMIKVRALDDAVVDGGDTQVFAPGPNTVSGILGPVFVDGAGGEGSLALNAPVMLPGETNRRPSDGNVVTFVANPGGGPGAIEQMTVETADLEAKRVALELASIDELVGLTIEMTRGQGIDVVLRPERPNEKFDRFWLITAIEPGDPGESILTLQNPSQLDVSQLAATDVPRGDDSETPDVDESSEYAITTLSVNFFVDENTQVDFMFVHDEDSPADSTGVLTPTRLFGLNMGPDLVIGGQRRPGGITYGDLEVLEINLGAGNNNFTVLGTHTREDGYQTWTFLNTGDDIEFNGVQGDTVTVKLNSEEEITASGTVTTAENADADENIFSTTVTLDQAFANGSLAGQLIRIVEDGLGENDAEADGQMRRIINNVGNVLTVDRVWEFIPDGEIYEIVNEADGAFAVNTQGGDDTVDASASSLGIVIFGGLGHDTITGGSGDDIIFGDRGRVDYFNEGDAIVTRLGDAPEPITGFVTTQVVDDPNSLVTIEDSGASFPVPDDVADGMGTDDIGLRGLYVDINNGAGFLQTIRLIEDNTGTTLTLTEPFDTDLDLPGPVPGDESEYRISTIPEDQTDGVVRDPTLLITVDNGMGGMDTIDAGPGNDQVFGGAEGDTISAGIGDDLVVGDAGRLDRSRDPAAPADPGFGEVVGSLYDRLRTIAFDQGGADTIGGNAGADLILGGSSGDTVYGDDVAGSAGAGDLADVIVGDNGEIEFVDGVISHIFTTDTTEATGGSDTISGNAGDDLILGGVNGSSDVLSGNGGDDILLGDDGELVYDDSIDPDLATLDFVRTGNVSLGGPDMIFGNAGEDLIFGGKGGDWIEGGSDDDLVFGDFAEAKLLANQLDVVKTIDATEGGADVIFGNEHDDLLVGGAAGDFIDGDGDDDLIFGDAVDLHRRLGDIRNPRFQVLLGRVIYSRYDLPLFLQGVDGLPADDPRIPTSQFNTGEVLVDGVARNYRDPAGEPVPAWAEYLFVDLHHSQTLDAGTFGDDYIAGGGGDDQIFGQLGDDLIQGDGGIESALDDDTATEAVGARRVVDPVEPIIALTPQDDDTPLPPQPRRILDIIPSFEAATDGDDYIEGNGGDDVIFGNLGQDDIIGGSSSLFTLTTRELRPDGADIIFGGAGTRINHNHDVTNANRNTIVLDEVHARDADAIAGDNANIFRLVGTGNITLPGGSLLPGTPDTNSFLRFNYDRADLDGYSPTLWIIPRAIQLLDYTPGGPDFDATNAANDIGVDDEVHGESGDDFVYGMMGKDILFGDSEDDDLIGGWGADWISGGTDWDGVLGDDGRIFTARYVQLPSTNGQNGGVVDPNNISHYAELLNGVFKVDQLNKVIDTPGDIQRAIINPAFMHNGNPVGELFKTVDLTPFNVDPDPLMQDPEFAGAHYANDIIFGGLGNDFLHGGPGDDAMVGAEALPEFFEAPINPDDPTVPGDDLLRFDAGRIEFADYNEDDPRTKLDPFVLNFDVFFDATPLVDDNFDEDAIFGDLGNDWLVGGPDNDNLFGGYGADLLDADDDKSTHDNLNDQPDGPHIDMQDRAFGGAGRDVLIANTGGDRLMDWIGEHDSFIVPFAPFGEFTVTRAVFPGLFEFLYDLSKSLGADPSRVADTGNEAARNGEPDGELGLITQQDGDRWQDQTGAPIDPQPGNIPGGERDTLRGVDFNSGTAQAFAIDSGQWQVKQGRYQVSPTTLGGDATAVFHVGEYIPNYFEVKASISTAKPLAGYKANSYVLFDYVNPTDFKFAGINVSTDKIEIGHRDASGWHVDVQTPAKLKSDINYDLLLAANGTTATFVVNGVVLSHAFAPRRDPNGFTYGLNYGMVGLGANNAIASIDNVVVQRLKPETTFAYQEDFADNVLDHFAAPLAGTWNLIAGRYEGTPGSGGEALAPFDLTIEPNSIIELKGTFTTGGLGGFFFDHYGDRDYKFAGVLPGSNQVVIGHWSKTGELKYDAIATLGFAAGPEYNLRVTLKGTTVSMAVGVKDGFGNVAYNEVLGHVFNAVTVDGRFGLLGLNGGVSFDSASMATDDPAFLQPSAGANLMAAAPMEGAWVGTVLTDAQLQPILQEAKDRWVAALGTALSGTFDSLAVKVADLEGLALGVTTESMILVDVNAAGYGWFLDPTPSDNTEFHRQANPGELVAKPSSDAFGRMDLLTVVMHELGHVLGLEDLNGEANAHALMGEVLDTGVRRLGSELGLAGGAPTSQHSAGTNQEARLLLILTQDGQIHDVEEEEEEYALSESGLIDWSGKGASRPRGLAGTLVR